MVQPRGDKRLRSKVGHISGKRCTSTFPFNKNTEKFGFLYDQVDLRFICCINQDLRKLASQPGRSATVQKLLKVRRARTKQCPQTKPKALYERKAVDCRIPNTSFVTLSRSGTFCFVMEMEVNIR